MGDKNNRELSKRYYKKVEQRYKKSKNNLHKIIIKLKKEGFLNDYISPQDLNKYLVITYRAYHRIKNKYEYYVLNKNNTCAEKYKKAMLALKERFINLCKPLIGMVIKRYSLYTSFDKQLATTDSIIAILNVLEKNSQNPQKSSLSSQIYENIRQLIHQTICKERAQEAGALRLVDDFLTEIDE